MSGRRAKNGQTHKHTHTHTHTRTHTHTHTHTRTNTHTHTQTGRRAPMEAAAPGQPLLNTVSARAQGRSFCSRQLSFSFPPPPRPSNDDDQSNDDDDDPCIDPSSLITFCKQAAPPPSFPQLPMQRDRIVANCLRNCSCRDKLGAFPN